LFENNQSTFRGSSVPYDQHTTEGEKTVQVRKLLLTLVTAVLISGLVSTANAAEAKGGLFINLTTDDTWSAAKAILFAHQKVLKAGHKPVAIWMNVRAIYLIDKKRASHVHGLMKQEGQSIQDMLTAFMNDGGIVIACGACSEAAGLTQADFIDGVQMGNPDLVRGLLFDPNVKTLGW
jgi:sulfur relay (sulfurtransferase) complex TusBCD TusD component (DsrE family)